MEEDAHTPPWHATSIDEVVAALRTRSDAGLTATEAERRLVEYGPNLLDEGEAPTWWRVLLRQFWDVLIAILLVAAALAFAVGETGDALTIVAIIVLNGVLGFVQEWRAEQALLALRGMLAPRAKVVRDGGVHVVDAETLVPGDILRLDRGDRVPADARVVSVANLAVDEAALTGESEPVAKGQRPVGAEATLSERTSLVFTGTAVTAGHASAVVVETGMRTEFGRIAHLTSSVSAEQTHLQKKLSTLGKWLGAAAIAISILITLGGILTGQEAIGMFMTGLALAVAVVPEGLPAVVTITLALGVRQMLKRRALIRKLEAAETLGAATVICTDKTGTLTQNAMTVQFVWTHDAGFDVTGVGYAPEGEIVRHGEVVTVEDYPVLRRLFSCGVRCNDAEVVEDDGRWTALGAPTEAALLTAAMKSGMSPSPDREIVREFSFDASRKRMSVVERGAGSELRLWVKGAPDLLLHRCERLETRDGEVELTPELRTRIEEALSEESQKGRRTLGMAWRPLEDVGETADEVERGLTFIGFVGIIDPPRAEVPDALAMAADAGIRTIMITGDSAETALAIAKQIGLDVDRAVRGPDVDAMNQDELETVLGEPILFARATPEHKLRIVEALQAMGEVVGMTGDGVNDAPALKRADIGIAMGERGTEVARGASEMVLTDDNFASIIGAVEEGRRQYDNIQKFVRYLLTSNFGEVVAIGASIMVGGPLILLPVQILWTNLVTDGVTAVALGAEPVERDTMRRPPRDPSAPLIDLPGIASIVLLGGYLGGATYGVFYGYLGGAPDQVARAQTMAFTGLIVFEKINVFNFRSLHSPLMRVGFFSNPWVIAAWLFNILMQIAAVYVPFLQDILHTVPLTAADWGLLLALGLPIFFLGEAKKWFWHRRAGT